MWKHIASNTLTVLIVGLFLAGGAVIWGMEEYRSEGPLETAFCLSVESGENFSTVGETLAERGAVSSEALFNIGMDYAATDTLKAGNFLIPAGASMEEIGEIITGTGRSTCGTRVTYVVGVSRNEALVEELDPVTANMVQVALFDPTDPLIELPLPYIAAVADNRTEFRLRVNEGTTTWQVATALSEMDIFEGVADGIPPEGTLAPDTYAVAPGMAVSDLLARMTAIQEARIAEAWASRQEGLPLEDEEDLLKLASIIEKETAQADERETVAGVFVNRLNAGMRLQTDPTVIYGVTEGRGILGRGLRRSELDAVTPWNTYRIDGLPQTPIANPSEASLMAAANPEETDYIFFVADGTGGHAFAVTLAEHNENVARWREIEAEREAALEAAEEAESSN